LLVVAATLAAAIGRRTDSLAARMIAPGMTAARGPIVAPPRVARTIARRMLAAVAREARPFAFARPLVVGAITARSITTGPLALGTFAAWPVPERSVAAWPVAARAFAARPIERRPVKFARPAIALSRARRTIFPWAIEFWAIKLRTIEFRAVAALGARAPLAAIRCTARALAILAKAAARLRSIAPFLARAFARLRAAKPLAGTAIVASIAARPVAMGPAVGAAADLARRARPVVARTFVVPVEALAARRSAAAAGASRRASPAVCVIVTWHIKSRFEVARLITEFRCGNERPQRLSWMRHWPRRAAPRPRARFRSA